MRWPVHPKPIENETLLSWLTRIASCYRLTLSELLLYGLQMQVNDKFYGIKFDFDDSLFVSELAYVTKMTTARLHSMTLPGLAEKILGSRDFNDQKIFDDYHKHMSVITGPGVRFLSPKPKWNEGAAAPWFSALHRTCVLAIRKHCPRCIKRYGISFRRLQWLTHFSQCCTLHKCLLVNNIELETTIRPANKELLIIEKLNQCALSNSFVQLGVEDTMCSHLWFRFLRRLVYELSFNRFQNYQCKEQKNILDAWNAAGLAPVSGGEFETLNAEEQQRTLSCAGYLISNWPHHLIPFVSLDHSNFANERTALPWALARYVFRSPSALDLSLAVRDETGKFWRLEWDHLMKELEYDICNDKIAEEQVFNLLVYGNRHTPEQARQLISDIKCNWSNNALQLTGHTVIKCPRTHYDFETPSYVYKLKSTEIEL